jgi:hypothetical protein
MKSADRGRNPKKSADRGSILMKSSNRGNNPKLSSYKGIIPKESCPFPLMSKGEGMSRCREIERNIIGTKT